PATNTTPDPVTLSDEHNNSTHSQNLHRVEHLRHLKSPSTEARRHGHAPAIVPSDADDNDNGGQHHDLCSFTYTMLLPHNRVAPYFVISGLLSISKKRKTHGFGSERKRDTSFHKE
ncbi:hypothetical protein RYX36_010232, partial [Vicia faba]